MGAPVSKQCGNTRNNSLDLLRIISAFSVILIHVNALYIPTDHTLYSWDLSAMVMNVFNLVTRFSVPVFMMLSGAFSLSSPSNADFKRYYCKFIYKIYLPTSLAVLLFIPFAFIEGFSLREILSRLIYGRFYNLWFIYTIFFLYLSVPIIIRLKTVISTKVYRLLAVSLLMLAGVSQIISTHNAPYTTGVIVSYLAYFLIGDIIYEHYQNQTSVNCSRLKIFLLSATIIALFIITFFLRQLGITPSKHIYDLSFGPYASFFSPMIIIASVLIFILFNNLIITVDFSKMASLTFYVYLLHTVCYRSLFMLLENRLSLCIIGRIVVLTVLTSLLSFSLALAYKQLWKMLDRVFKSKWYSLRIWHS